MIKSPKIIATLILCIILAIVAIFVKKTPVPIKKITLSKKVIPKNVDIKSKPKLSPSKMTMSTSGSLQFGQNITNTSSKNKVLLKINDNMDNIIIEKREGFTTNDNTPSNTLAYNLSIYNKHISWKPKWRFIGTGKLWIQDVSISKDNSVLAFIETTGDDKGPYGSQIVLMNTFNWKVLKIIKIPQTISKCCFIPKTMQVALICNAQKVLEYKGDVLIYNLKTEHNRKLNLTTEICDIITNHNGTKLFIKPKLQKQIIVLDIEQFSIKNIKSDNSTGKFSISPYGNILALGGDNSIEMFQMTTNSLSRKIKLSEKSQIGSIKLITKQDFVIIYNNSNIAFYKNNSFLKNIGENASSLISFDYDSQKLIIEKKLNDSLDVLSYPEMNLLYSAIPKRIRPKARHSAAIFLQPIPRLKKYLVFDCFGNLYTLHKPKKKWKKNVIFSIFNDE